MKPLKERIVLKCITEQSKVMANLKKEIDDTQLQTNVYGQPGDRYDTYKTKLMRQVELFSKQFVKAKVVIDTLPFHPMYSFLMHSKIKPKESR